MKSWLSVCVLIAAASGLWGGSHAAWAEMARYEVDRGHSIIEFRVAHMVISKTTGRFKDYSGFIEMDPEARTVNTIEATIQTASIDTNHEKRDTHLRNADFLDVAAYPTMTYVLNGYEQDGDGYQATGLLTLRGITKEIALTGTFNGVTTDPWGNVRAGFSAEGTLNRRTLAWFGTRRWTAVG